MTYLNFSPLKFTITGGLIKEPTTKSPHPPTPGCHSCSERRQTNQFPLGPRISIEAYGVMNLWKRWSSVRTASPSAAGLDVPFTPPSCFDSSNPLIGIECGALGLKLDLFDSVEVSWSSPNRVCETLRPRRYFRDGNFPGCSWYLVAMATQQSRVKKRSKNNNVNNECSSTWRHTACDDA